MAKGSAERLARLVAAGVVAVRLVAAGLVLAEPVAAGLVLAEPVAAEVAADGRAADGRAVCPLPGAVAGLNVATDSIAPATRHTARMLASSGMTVPCPAKGPASRRNRFLRLCARISRW